MRRSWVLLVVMATATAACGGDNAAVTDLLSATTATTTTAATTTTIGPTTTASVTTTTTTAATTTTVGPTTTASVTTTTTAPLPMVDVAGLIDADLPLSGEVAGPDLAPFVEAVAGFMAEHGIPAGVLAVSADGELLADVGLGWLDADATTPVPAGTPMRIASITKPITLAALRIAARDFDIGWDDRVWCTEAGQIGCWLQIEPASGGFADGLGDITIRQLVYHEGGFDRNASFDPMFRSLQIASELGLDRPPEAVEVAAYMASQPLDFAPGTRAEYSNFGYLLLGLAIEEATGTDLVEFLRETVFTVAGDDDVQLGATLPEDRDPREPYYYCPGWSLSVFDGTTEVCWPDGGWYLEAMEAHGGLVMPAHTLIAFLDHFCLDGKAHEPWEACGDWGFYGSLDGTLTLAGQRSSGVNYAVFFNRRDGVAPDDLIAMMDGQADALAEGR